MNMNTDINKLSALFLALCMGGAVAEAQFSAPKRAYLESLVTTDHPDRIYRTGENATVTVQAFKGGLPVDSV